MKMSLVVRDWNDRILRAAMPGEAAADSGVPLLRHIPAHWANVDRGAGAKREHQKESVLIGCGSYHPKDGKFERIRTLPESVIAQLDGIDFQRETLKKQIRDLDFLEKGILTAHYDQSAKLKMTDVRGFKHA